MTTANAVLKQAASWIGYSEANGKFKTIIDTYNAHKPLPRSYAVKYTDEWCATFVSAVAIKAGAADIIPQECSCNYMIAGFKKLNKWVENDAYTPKPGDIIFYDWQDSGAGDNTGSSDHVGIVEKVSGGTITVIEGNYSEKVARRTIKVNGRYIRGYGTPAYKTEAATVKPAIPAEGITKMKAIEGAKEFSKALAGAYTVTATGLNVRTGAGTNKAILTTIPNGTRVMCYGYYTTLNGTKWLYIQFSRNGIEYTGFASGDYLRK